jgi:tripartite-type tricarboxylate transporter receptor subunit TctC
MIVELIKVIQYGSLMRDSTLCAGGSTMLYSLLRCGLLHACFVGVLIGLDASRAFPQADFYKGKTIRVVRGGGPGGSGEFQTRALVRFLAKHIPGNPNIIVEFIEGAAGRKAANVIYSSTRPDGLTIGSIGAGLVVGPILGLPGSNYDLDKLVYLGSTDTGDPYVFYTKGDKGLDNLEKLRAAGGLRFGAHAVGHPVYVTARFVAYLLSLKDPKFVTGFTGPEIYIALTRGELDAHATGAARFVIEQPEWIEKKLVHFHTTLTVPKGRHHPSFAHLPELGSFAKSETERKLLDMFRAFQYPRWPYIFPPGTPKDRVQIVREAMRKSFSDPEFPAEYKKLMGDPPVPLAGEELERAIKELPREPEVVQLYKKLAGADPLPTR